MSDLPHLSTESFPAEVGSHKGVAVVDFYADWCGPCRMLGPIFEQLSTEYAGTDVKFAKLNVDEARDIAVKHGIRAVPTILVFKDGVEVERMMGVHAPATIKEKVEKHRKNA